MLRALLIAFLVSAASTQAADRPMADGVRFDNAYANCPVCSPTRASFLTGRYPDMVGVPGVIRTFHKDNWKISTPRLRTHPSCHRTKALFKVLHRENWISKDRAKLVALIEDSGSAIGSVTVKLKDFGLDDNTLVVFTSDNGG